MQNYAKLLVLDCANMLFMVVFNISQPQGPQGCATMRLSSSVSQTGAVSPLPGSVMVIQTVRIAVTNTTPVPLAPAPPHSSAATMGTVCYAAGFVMGTMTAET